MPSLLVQGPDLGLNGLKQINALDPREAAYSTDIIYENGLLKRAWGFAKLDLTTSGLNSGDIVLAIFPYKEADDYYHLLAATTEKIYRHDPVNDTWTDKTQSGLTMPSNIDHPVSHVTIEHSDGLRLDEDTTKSKVYHHCIVCNGGMGNIQRWAGRYESDFCDLSGGGGYHDGTTHRALQVGNTRSRLVLISPQLYDSASNSWSENNQRVQWPCVGKLETWTGSGSGFADLRSTGGTNVWSARLGGDYYIYQTQGIWSLNWVGGEKVFDPRPWIPDLGLLSHHLLATYANVHYFVGTDYNVYAYYGGTIKRAIGDKIRDSLEEDMAVGYKERCKLVVGPHGKRLWIFIVQGSNSYITKAYGMDLRTETWMKRDFSGKFSSGEGLTAAGTIGAQTYTIGDSYAAVLDVLSAYDAADYSETPGDTTVRYGDKLMDCSRTLTALASEISNASWKAGGLDCSKGTSGDFSKCFTENDILMTIDGSTAKGIRHGTHFYTVYDVSTNGFSVRERETTAQDGTALGIAPYATHADASWKVPSDYSTGILNFYSACSYDDPDETYRQELEEVRTKERLLAGDATGYIFEFDSSIVYYDSQSMAASHITPVFDLGKPDKLKRWNKISIVGSQVEDTTGAMFVRYKTDNFDNNSYWTGSTDYSIDLTDTFIESDVYINQTSKRIQFDYHDFCAASGYTFQIREFEIFADILDDR